MPKGGVQHDDERWPGGGQNRTPVVGPGNLDISPQAYALAIRMFADNFLAPQVGREIEKRFGEKIKASTVRRIKETRRTEIEALRTRLNTELERDDALWIVTKRQRLLALQKIFEDCNQWVPSKLLQPGPVQAGQGVPTAIVYSKNTRGMLDALKAARDELGVSPEASAAQSLSDMVRIAEEQRGLERTVGSDEPQPDDALPIVLDAELIESPEMYASAGGDETMGILPGDAQPVVELPERAADPQPE